MLQNEASQAALNASGSTDARNDVDALPAGSPGPATGNVISGSGTLTGATGADAGASIAVVAIQGDGGGAEMTPASSGPMEVQGRYGTLTIDAQGNYSYVRNAGTADGVQDVFTYTVAGAGGARDTATLTILLTRDGETVQPNQIVQTDDGVVILPAGVELSDIRVVGRDLVITLPDGSTMTIPNGAVFVPQLVIGDVEVPPANLAALLIDAEPRPASGTPQMSSGGNFAGDVPPLDPGVPLGDLLPPTQMTFPVPDFREVGQIIDRRPEVGPNPAVQLDDETLAGGIPGGTGDVSPDTANTTGTLSASGGDGPLTFDLLASGAPSGFSYVDGPGGSIIIRQGTTDVIRVDINAATGAYTVTQLAPISHPGGGDENDVSFTLAYTVTDRDGDSATGSLTVNVDDDSPTVTNVQTGPGVTLDETSAVPGGFPISATSASAAITATLAFGADLAALSNSTVYGLALQGGGTSLDSGLRTAVGDHAITLVLVNSTTIQGQYNGTNVAFTIVLNGNGTVTVTQNVALEHNVDGSSAAAHDDSLNLSGKVNAIVTITDRDGDSATGTAPIGAGIVFKDDGPTINVTIISEREPTLLTQDAETIGAASDTAVSSANFNNAFGVSFTGGADGAAAPSLSYTLGVSAQGVDSGLDQSGSNIYLYLIGGKVVGSTSATQAGVTSGNTVFDVSVSATGVVTLTQYSQIDHPAAGDPSGTGAPFDDHIVWMADSLVTLTASSTVTDNDGDTASDSETINIGANLRFADDGPDISAALTGTQIRIDETDGVVAAGGEVDPLGGNLGTVTMSAASLYTVTNAHTSADAPTSYSYALVLSAQGVASGLLLSTTNAPIFLYNIGGTIYGSTAASAGAVNSGNTAFTVSINGSGDVTVTQFLAVEHPTPGASHDEDSSSIAAGALSVQITATDFDGDTDVASVDIGSRMVFEDDGPSIDVTAGAVAGVILQTDDPQTIGAASDTAVSTANFSGVFGVSFSGGADGAASAPVLGYALDVTGYAGGPAGVDSGLNQGGSDIFLYEIGGKVVGSTSATLAGVTAGNTVFDVAVSASGVVTLTQYSQIDHPIGSDPSPTGSPFSDQLIWMADSLVTLTASSTVTDNDGDTATDSATVAIGANLRFSDDGPDISVTATTTQIRIDETDGVVAAGGEVDPLGGNLGTVTMSAASLYTVTNVHTSADAPTSYSYALTLSSQGANSGLLLSTTNAPLFLYKIGGVVYASTSTTEAGVNLATNVAFTVSINGSGDVTVTQYLAVEHPTPGASHDEDSSPMASGLINVSVTATDFDGDTDVASVDIGSRIVFEDDGPAINVAKGDDGAVILTTQDADTIGTNTDTASSTANFSGVFSIASSSGGSDGTASISAFSYALDVTGYTGGPAGVDSGLNQGGSDIFLYEIGGKVVGSTSATLAGVNAGNTVFDVSVSSTGVVTLTQYSQIDHPIADDPSATAAPFTDQLIWMADNLVTLTASATITDNDGDTATDTETVSIGANLRFVDDGPVAVADTNSVTEGGSTSGNVLTDGTDDSFGADGMGSIQGVAAGSSTASPVSGGIGVPIVTSLGTLTLNANGSYTYVSHDNSVTTTQVDTFVYTIVDADGDTSTVTLSITIGPVNLVADNDTITVNEAALDTTITGSDVAAGSVTGSNPSSTAETTSGTLSVAGAVSYSLNSPSVGSYGTLVLNSNGTYTYTLTQPYDTTPDSNNGTNTELAKDVFTYTATDANGNTVQGTISVNIIDDVPSVEVTKGSDTAVLLETQDAQTIGASVQDTAVSTANFSGVFGLTYVAGADGAAAPTLSYALDVTGFVNSGPGTAGVDSGLNQTGSDIFLYEIGGKVVGSTSATLGGVNAGNTVFDVAVSSTGVVTLTQYSQIDHPAETPSGSPFDDQFVSLLDTLVTLTASSTITDGDGDQDSDSETVNIGANLRFYDHGPSAAISLTGIAISHDETAGLQGDADDVSGPLSVFSGVTNAGDDPDVAGTGPLGYARSSGAVVSSTGSTVGADTSGTTVFSLNVSSAGVDSGLDVTGGQSILLYKEGSLIVGRVSGGPLDGKAAFAIAIDPATRQLSMVQYLSIKHPDATQPDESVSIANGAILATVTVTDFDNDTSEVSTAIGSLISFQDDAPIITAASDINIQNSGDVAATGTFAFNLGADGPLATNDAIKSVTFTAVVNGVTVTGTTPVNLTQVSEDADTAVFNFSFTYGTGTGTATNTGTITFYKTSTGGNTAGTYKVDLADPIAGVTVLDTAGASASAFKNYEPGGTVASNSPTEVSVVELASNVFVQFTGVAEPGAGTGANNLVTVDFSSTTGTASGTADTGTDAAEWQAGELFTQDSATVTVSSSAAGVAGNTIQGGEVLDFNLYSTDPKGTLGLTPTQQSTSMFIKLDGIGTSEDFIVILKLYDTSTGQYTTRAIIVENGDILRGPADNDPTTAAPALPAPYQNITLDNNDGLVVIEANDYQQGNTNLVIVGAQIAGSDEGISGEGINLNGAIGGASSGTQPFSTDSSDAPFKISSIGFLIPTTTNQNATLTFNVTVQDGDLDTVSQTLTATVTSSADSSTPITLDPSVTTIQSSTMLLASSDTSSDMQMKSMNAANTNTMLLGAIAAAGIVEAAAAEEPGGAVSMLGAADPAVGDSLMETASAVSGNDGASRSLMGGETREVDTAADLPDAASRGQDVAAEARALADTRAEAQSPLADLLEATDTPAVSNAPASAPAEVAMPAAHVLAEAFGNGAEASGQHTQELGRILADALAGGGNGPSLDAVIDAAGGKAHGAPNALEGLAIPPGADVPAWDMSGIGGFTASHAMSMEAMLAHPDAPAQHGA